MFCNVPTQLTPLGWAACGTPDAMPYKLYPSGEMIMCVDHFRANLNAEVQRVFANDVTYRGMIDE